MGPTLGTLGEQRFNSSKAFLLILFLNLSLHVAIKFHMSKCE